jgi:predicted ATPase
VLTDREERIIEALSIVEPRLERIVMVKAGRSRRTAMAKVKGRSPLPLRSLGDGMNRLLEVALGLVSVGEGGTFLVDEIDAGLHFTTLVDVWRLVFEAAARLDVQVVATTHSWDCIEAFQQAAVAHPAEGVLVRLQRKDETFASEVFTEDDLTIISRESIEVR